MSDLIDRKAAIDAFEDTSFTKNEIRRRLLELPSAQPVAKDINVPVKDCISRQDAIDAFYKHPNIDWTTLDVLAKINALPSVQQEDYTELKREFIRMASYIDVLLECSDVQKETLIGFISRLSEFMPWTERD